MALVRFKDSGDLYLSKPVKKILDTYIIGSDDSIFYITIWSIMHVVSGILIAAVILMATSWSFLKSALVAFIIHSLWEIWQWAIQNTPQSLRGVLDIVMDTILFMVGFAITYCLARLC
jgi:hypothetical protein